MQISPCCLHDLCSFFLYTSFLTLSCHSYHIYHSCFLPSLRSQSGFLPCELLSAPLPIFRDVCVYSEFDFLEALKTQNLPDVNDIIFVFWGVMGFTIRRCNKLTRHIQKHLFVSVLVWPAVWVTWGHLGSESHFQPSFSCFFLQTWILMWQTQTVQNTNSGFTNHSLTLMQTAVWFTQTLSNESSDIVLLFHCLSENL